jgi:hypothetical protein
VVWIVFPRRAAVVWFLVQCTYQQHVFPGDFQVTSRAFVRDGYQLPGLPRTALWIMEPSRSISSRAGRFHATYVVASAKEARTHLLPASHVLRSSTGGFFPATGDYSVYRGMPSFALAHFTLPMAVSQPCIGPARSISSPNRTATLVVAPRKCARSTQNRTDGCWADGLRNPPPRRVGAGNV